MKYLLPLSEQLNTFFYSIGFGFLSGVFYRMLMLIRDALSRRKGFVFAFDLLFCVAETVAAFCFLLVYSDGEVRLNLIFGGAAGFIMYRLTLDRAVAPIFAPIAALPVKAVRLVLKPFAKLFGLIKSKLPAFFVKFKGRLRKNKAEKPEETPVKPKKSERTEKNKRKVKLFAKTHLKSFQ